MAMKAAVSIGVRVHMASEAPSSWHDERLALGGTVVTYQKAEDRHFSRLSDRFGLIGVLLLALLSEDGGYPVGDEVRGNLGDRFFDGIARYGNRGFEITGSLASGQWSDLMASADLGVAAARRTSGSCPPSRDRSSASSRGPRRQRGQPEVVRSFINSA